MLSFKHFILEAKVTDYRSEENKLNGHPFVVTRNMYGFKEPLLRDMGLHDYNSDYHFGEHRPNKSKEEKYQLNNGSGYGFVVNPQNKTINLDISKQQNSQPRRYYKSLKKSIESYNKNASIGRVKYDIPILGSDISEIPHHHLRKTLKELLQSHPIHDYTIHGDERFEGKKVSDFIKEKTEHEKFMDNEPITVYHGTSEKRAKEILQHGIKQNKRGFDYTQVPEYSKGKTYFTTNPSEAANYATREHIEDKSNPVILKIKIHPKHFHKIMPDEDNLNWSQRTFPKRIQDTLDKMFPATIPPTSHYSPDRRVHFQELIHKGLNNPRYTGYVDPDLVPSRMDVGEYRNHVGRQYLKHFLAHRTLNKNTSFAFTGEIDPKHIAIHKTWVPIKTKHDPEDDEYFDAIEKMKKTVKNSL